MSEASRRATRIVPPAAAASPFERRQDWWRGAVIYQIYPRSFFDSNGDGVGDLPGVLAKLDYVASLGVDAIWLSPFFTSPMKDFGYDVADHCAVDPIFGTLADFDRLVGRAHELGLKVVIDQVWCHTSDHHPWFVESRASRDGDKADWYVWADARPDGTPPNNWLSVFGGAAWTWDPRRRQYYMHHFLASQPQLNLRRQAVVDAVLASGTFWLERGVDGFRLDAVDFLLHDEGLRDNPPATEAGAAPPARPFGMQRHVYDMLQPEAFDVLRQIRRLTDRHPGTATLAEVSSQDGAFDRIQAYTAGDDLLHMAYTLRLLRGKPTPALLRQALEGASRAPSKGWACWAFGNHDAERAVTRWRGPGGSAHGFARMLMALSVALGGSICIYQGEELGLPDAELEFADLRDPFGIAFYPEFRGRDGSRTPLPWIANTPHAGFTSAPRPWLPVPDAHHEFAVETQERDPGSPLHTLRRLLAWRKTQPVLLHGEVEALPLDEPLFGCVRTLGRSRLIFACNFSDRPVVLPYDQRGGLTPLRDCGFTVEVGDGIIMLPAYGVLFADDSVP